MQKDKELLQEKQSKRGLSGRDPADAKIIMNLIDQIVAIRTKRGISQRELAIRCDMPQSSIARIETCHTLPNMVTLVHVLRALNLHIEVKENVERERRNNPPLSFFHDIFIASASDGASPAPIPPVKDGTSGKSVPARCKSGTSIPDASASSPDSTKHNADSS